MVTSKLDTCRTRNYKSVVVKLLKLNILLTWKMILLSPALYFQLVCLFIVLALAYDHFFSMLEITKSLYVNTLLYN